MTFVSWMLLGCALGLFFIACPLCYLRGQQRGEEVIHLLKNHEKDYLGILNIDGNWTRMTEPFSSGSRMWHELPDSTEEATSEWPDIHP